MTIKEEILQRQYDVLRDKIDELFSNIFVDDDGVVAFEHDGITVVLDDDVEDLVVEIMTLTADMDEVDE